MSKSSMKIEQGSQSNKWTIGLCGCLLNPCTCLTTWCLPCVTFGQIAEIVDEGQSSCCGQGCLYCVLMMCGFHWVASSNNRAKLRTKFGLPADPCSDCCVHYCCEPCALCQEHAELQNRGLDPSRGWTGPPNAPPPVQMPPTIINK